MIKTSLQLLIKSTNHKLMSNLKQQLSLTKVQRQLTITLITTNQKQLTPQTISQTSILNINSMKHQKRLLISFQLIKTQITQT